MDSLIQRLKDKPSIEKVYLNDKGEWLFHPNKNFPIVKTRDEILKKKPVQTN